MQMFDLCFIWQENVKVRQNTGDVFGGDVIVPTAIQRKACSCALGNTDEFGVLDKRSGLANMNMANVHLNNVVSRERRKYRTCPMRDKCAFAAMNKRHCYLRIAMLACKAAKS